MSIAYNPGGVFDQEAPEFLRMVITVARRHRKTVEIMAPELRLVANCQGAKWLYSQLEIVGHAFNLEVLTVALAERGISYSYALEV